MIMAKRIAVLAAVTALLIPQLARAQASIAGKWSTEFDIGIRNENGVETSMGKRQATLVLTMKGDSIFGTWTVAPLPDGPAPAPVKITGVRNGAKFTFQQE